MINQRNTWNYKKRASEDENILEKLTFVEDFYWFSLQHSCFLLVKELKTSEKFPKFSYFWSCPSISCPILRFNGKFCIIHNVALGPPVYCVSHLDFHFEMVLLYLEMFTVNGIDQWEKRRADSGIIR